jgi:hypothetical protein
MTIQDGYVRAMIKKHAFSFVLLCVGLYTVNSWQNDLTKTLSVALRLLEMALTT